MLPETLQYDLTLVLPWNTLELTQVKVQIAESFGFLGKDSVAVTLHAPDGTTLGIPRGWISDAESWQPEPTDGTKWYHDYDGNTFKAYTEYGTPCLKLWFEFISYEQYEKLTQGINDLFGSAVPVASVAARPSADVLSNAQLVTKLAKIIPGMTAEVAHPVTGDWCPEELQPQDLMPVMTQIMHLNDSHEWTYEEITEWLDTLDVDLTVQVPDREEIP